MMGALRGIRFRGNNGHFSLSSRLGWPSIGNRAKHGIQLHNSGAHG